MEGMDGNDPVAPEGGRIRDIRVTHFGLLRALLLRQVTLDDVARGAAPGKL